MRKGITETIAFSVLTFLMIGTLSTIAMQNVVGVGDLIQRETVQLQAERIEKVVYAIDSFEEAKVEMGFSGNSGYNVYSEGGERYISYSFYGQTGKEKMEDPFGIGFDVEPGPDSDATRAICMIKESGQIEIESGGC